ncbi:MAG: RNA polymerase-associated protein RapA [Calditrichia bacterium]
MSSYSVGQRWISEMEPELGLGIILRVEHRTITILFPGSNDMRQYAMSSAPLKRVRFKVGDRITDQGGGSFTVENVAEENNLLIYEGEGGRRLPESQLSDSLSFSTPEERLLAGQADKRDVFDLRADALETRFRLRHSPMRGFLGGRIDLIPHQFYIANEISKRQLPRVLLSDEVGLGKTIEACLILHRLLISGRIGRVLILVPPALIHQWYLEMMRRFNIKFRIVDESYCEGVESSSPDSNPFLEDQLALCNINFLSREGIRQEQAIAAGWDMLIVDEAHHVRRKTNGYKLLQRLTESIERVLLLTATPEKLGRESHFSRLQLLDNARYSSYSRFQKEADGYAETAVLAGALLDGRPLLPAQAKLLEKLPLKSRYSAAELVQNKLSKNERDEIIDTLLDRHGTGRVMFRNTRSAIKGFPQRLPKLAALPGSSELKKQLQEEFKSDAVRGAAEPEYLYRRDPRVKWLTDMLREMPDEKILLICRTRNRAEGIQTAVQQIINVKSALFHEDMALIKRDQNAAWFAQEDGAQLLICSEIGSEGRNFQFAHHLVLFDLPLNPELLEQRVGRLDRIGQSEDINIHVPYVTGSPQAFLARWYHEGLNALERHLPGGQQIAEAFGAKVAKAALAKPGAAHDQLIAETKTFSMKLRKTLEQGRDRLLELSSFRPHEARDLVRQVRETERDQSLQHFLSKMFDHFGVKYQDLSQHISHIRAGDMKADAFPGFDDNGMRITFHRRIALSREDLHFLSWDHPMVTGSIELMLGTEEGNCAIAEWRTNEEEMFFVEAYFVAECVAPGHLVIDRFFPPLPIRVVLNDLLEDYTEHMSREILQRNLRDLKVSEVSEDPDFTKYRFGEMLAECKDIAEKRNVEAISQATESMEQRLGSEIKRLQELRKVNKNITAAEIERAEREIPLLRKHISEARLRLDCLRVIRKGRKLD